VDKGKGVGKFVLGGGWGTGRQKRGGWVGLGVKGAVRKEGVRGLEGEGEGKG